MFYVTDFVLAFLGVKCCLFSRPANLSIAFVLYSTLLTLVRTKPRSGFTPLLFVQVILAVEFIRF